MAPSRSVRRADAGRLAPSTSPQRGRALSAEFQRELVASYQPRGQEPCPPALLAMVTLLEKYDQPSDADAVDAAENDRRWQLVLGTSGNESAPFGQGTLVRFRTRAITNALDQKLLDRTIELAKRTGSSAGDTCGSPSTRHRCMELGASRTPGILSAGRQHRRRSRGNGDQERRAEHSLGRQHQSGTGRRLGRRPGPGRGAPAIANLHEVARRRAA